MKERKLEMKSSKQVNRIEELAIDDFVEMTDGAETVENPKGFSTIDIAISITFLYIMIASL